MHATYRFGRWPRPTGRRDTVNRLKAGLFGFDGPETGRVVAFPIVKSKLRKRIRVRVGVGITRPKEKGRPV